jgi:hypothetical protein
MNLPIDDTHNAILKHQIKKLHAQIEDLSIKREQLNARIDAVIKKVGAFCKKQNQTSEGDK